MKKPKNMSDAVAGIVAPPPQPTVLGAALIATLITFPVAVTILLIDLILL